MAGEENYNDFQWTNVRNQYYAAVASSLITLGHGCMLGWVAPSIPKLASESTQLLSGPLTTSEISWIGSIGAVGVIFGSILFGFLTSVIGCKHSTVFLSVPTIAFWVLIYFGDLYYHILIARLLSGIAFGGVQTTVVLYISEIGNDNIRGRLECIVAAGNDVGILISYMLFSTRFLDKLAPLICISIPVLFAMIFITLPNTTQYYLSKKQFQNAEYSFKFYKGYTGHSQYEQSAFYIEFERLKLIASKRKEENKVQFTDFCNRNAMKGLGIGISLVVFSQFTANVAIMSYSVSIFEIFEKNKISSTSSDPYLSAIVLAIILIFGSFLGTYFADILRRRILNFISLAGSAIGLFTISLYQYLKLNGYELPSFECVPLISLSFVIFVSSTGIMKLATICSVENLPPKIRTCGMVIISLFISISVFICLKTFPMLMEMFNLYGCMMIFGIGCSIGAIFVLCVLKETSGLSLDNVGMNDEIENDVSNNLDQQPLIHLQHPRLCYHTFNKFRHETL